MSYFYSPVLHAILYPALTLFAFSVAIYFAVTRHYEQVVGTHCSRLAGHEWFPSLSAVIGDHNPSRFLFRFFMMWAPMLRWTTILGQYQLYAFTSLSPSQYEKQHQQHISSISSSSGSSASSTTAKASRRQVEAANILFYVDILRMSSAVGWIAIASTDNMTVHIGSFIVFIILSFVGAVFSIRLLSAIVDSRDAHIDSKTLRLALSLKRLFFGIQVALLAPIAYFYYRHIQYCESGAYSKYNLCEWSWAFTNILYDSCLVLELRNLHIRVVFDTTVSSTTSSSSSSAAASLPSTDVPKNK